MSQFQYFIPGVSQATPQILADRGLCSLIPGSKAPDGLIAKLISRVVSPSGRGVRGGPGGLHGVIVGESITGYYPDRQTWVPAPQGDADQPPYWIGFDSASKPTPSDLQRDELLTSKPVTFRDGTVWQVPVLREWSPGESTPVIWDSPLPMMVGLNRYGQAVEDKVVPEYRDLFDVGARILFRMIGSETLVSDVTPETYIQFAADVLGMNYRVSLLELSSSVLDCLSTEDAMKVVKHAVDAKGYLAAMGNWAGRQGRPDTDTNAGSAA